MDSLSKLNLACGHEYLDGYINIDDCSMYSALKVDKQANILELDFSPATITEVRLSHFAMYLRPESMSSFLNRCKIWLVLGGKLEMECIDIKKVAKIVSSEKSIDKLNRWGLTNLFGNEITKPHQWGWSPATLMVALYQAGFSDVKVSKGNKKPDRDFLIIAIK